MKKALLLFIVLFIISGCEKNTLYQNNEKYIINNLEIICSHQRNDEYISYLRDYDTDIIYIQYSAMYRYSLSAYYNSIGQPMTYEEFKIIHIEKYHK